MPIRRITPEEEARLSAAEWRMTFASAMDGDEEASIRLAGFPQFTPLNFTKNLLRRPQTNLVRDTTRDLLTGPNAYTFNPATRNLPEGAALTDLLHGIYENPNGPHLLQRTLLPGLMDPTKPGSMIDPANAQGLGDAAQQALTLPMNAPQHKPQGFWQNAVHAVLAPFSALSNLVGSTEKIVAAFIKNKVYIEDALARPIKGLGQGTKNPQYKVTTTGGKTVLLDASGFLNAQNAPPKVPQIVGGVKTLVPNQNSIVSYEVVGIQPLKQPLTVGDLMNGKLPPNVKIVDQQALDDSIVEANTYLKCANNTTHNIRYYSNALRAVILASLAYFGITYGGTFLTSVGKNFQAPSNATAPDGTPLPDPMQGTPHEAMPHLGDGIDSANPAGAFAPSGPSGSSSAPSNPYSAVGATMNGSVPASGTAAGSNGSPYPQGTSLSAPTRPMGSGSPMVNGGFGSVGGFVNGPKDDYMTDLYNADPNTSLTYNNVVDYGKLGRNASMRAAAWRLAQAQAAPAPDNSALAGLTPPPSMDQVLQQVLTIFQANGGTNSQRANTMVQQYLSGLANEAQTFLNSVDTMAARSRVDDSQTGQTDSSTPYAGAQSMYSPPAGTVEAASRLFTSRKIRRG